MTRRERRDRAQKKARSAPLIKWQERQARDLDHPHNHVWLGYLSYRYIYYTHPSPGRMRTTHRGTRFMLAWEAKILLKAMTKFMVAEMRVIKAQIRTKEVRQSDTHRPVYAYSYVQRHLLRYRERLRVISALYQPGMSTRTLDELESLKAWDARLTWPAYVAPQLGTRLNQYDPWTYNAHIDHRERWWFMVQRAVWDDLPFWWRQKWQTAILWREVLEAMTGIQHPEAREAAYLLGHGRYRDDHGLPIARKP